MSKARIQILSVNNINNKGHNLKNNYCDEYHNKLHRPNRQVRHVVNRVALIVMPTACLSSSVLPGTRVEREELLAERMIYYRALFAL